MTEDEKKFSLYLTVLRFLAFKITNNLKRIHLDINLQKSKMYLSAFYAEQPSELELELELLDDIVTNSNAHVPDLFVESEFKLIKDLSADERHDFIVFAVHD